MSISLSRRETGMAKELLDHPQVGPAVQEMRRKGVAQAVRSHTREDSRRLEVFLDNSGNASRRNPASPTVQKDRPFPLYRPFQLPFLLCVAVTQRFERYFSNGNDTFLGSFPDNSDNAQLKVNIVPVEANQLADANSRRIEHLQHGAVSNLRGIHSLNTTQQVEDLVDRKKSRERFPLLRARKERERIPGDALFFEEVTKKTLKRSKFSTHRALAASLRQGSEIFPNHMMVYGLERDVSFLVFTNSLSKQKLMKLSKVAQVIP